MWRVSEGLSWPERCLCASLGQEVGSPSWRIATILKAGDSPISTSTEIHEADLGELNGIDTFGALPVCGGIEILVARHAGAQGRLESQVGATTWKAGGSTGVMALPLDGAKKMCWSAIFTFTSFTSFTTVPFGEKLGIRIYCMSSSWVHKPSRNIWGRGYGDDWLGRFQGQNWVVPQCWWSNIPNFKSFKSMCFVWHKMRKMQNPTSF